MNFPKSRKAADNGTSRIDVPQHDNAVLRLHNLFIFQASLKKLSVFVAGKLFFHMHKRFDKIFVCAVILAYDTDNLEVAVRFDCIQDSDLIRGGL